MKGILLLFTLLTGAAFAGPHTLHGYQVSKDGQTRFDSQDVFESVSAPVRKGIIDHVVTLNVPKSYKDKDGTVKTWVDKINVHFYTAGAARKFQEVMNSHKGTDLYYDFHDNAYNGEGSMSACASALIGLGCRDDFPVTIVNYHDLKASDLFAYDKSKGVNVPLMDYLDEAGELALLEGSDQKELALGSEADDTERGISSKHDLDGGAPAKKGHSGTRATNA